MAQDRINFWVEAKRADFEASLVIDRMRDLIIACEYDKGLLEHLQRYDAWMNLRSQWEDFVNSAYVELPDDAG